MIHIAIDDYGLAVLHEESLVEIILKGVGVQSVQYGLVLMLRKNTNVKDRKPVFISLTETSIIKWVRSLALPQPSWQKRSKLSGVVRVDLKKFYHPVLIHGRQHSWS